MIYLIDDTNLHDFGAGFIFEEPYNQVIKLISSEPEYESIDEWDLMKCICVHRTFCNDVKIKNQITNITNEGNRIPLIIFSAGDNPVAAYEPTENKNLVGGLRKSVFYSRLRTFLDNFITNEVIDIADIAFGTSKSFHTLKPLCLSVLKKLEETNPYQEDIIENILNSEDFKEIISLANPALEVSHEDILSEYENNTISVNDIKNNIISILTSFEKYGKNIYPWE